MKRVVDVKGVSENKVEIVKKNYQRRGAQVVSEKQPDGTWTLAVTFPDKKEQ